MIADTADASGAQGPRPVAYDNSSGELSLPEGFREQMELIRLSNKQVVPRTPDFQCPETECYIPNAFVNDDFCDCPMSCADEAFHACDSCGVDLPPFSQETDACHCWKTCESFTSSVQNPKRIIIFAENHGFLDAHFTSLQMRKIMDSFHTWFLQLHLFSFASTATKDVCPDLRCLDIVTGLIDRPRCVGLGSAVDPFLCPPVDDSNTPCTIDRSLVDNNQCDCPGTCADESSWTCQNCSCVTWYILIYRVKVFHGFVVLCSAVFFFFWRASRQMSDHRNNVRVLHGEFVVPYFDEVYWCLWYTFIYFCDLLCLFSIETWNFSKGELLWSSALWVLSWWWTFPMPRDARFQLQPSSESSKQRSVRLSRDLCGWGPNPKLWRTGFSSELRGLPMSWGMWTVLVFLVKYCASQLQLPATSGSWNLCLWAILGTTATFSMSTTWRMLVATVLCEWQCLRLSRNMCRWGWLELWYLHLSGSVWDKESQLFWFAFSLPRQLLYNQHFPRQRRELWLPHLCWWGSFYLWNLQCRMSHRTELQQFARISMRSSSFFLPSYIGWNDLLPVPSQLCEWQRLRLPRLLWWTELGLLQLFCRLHGVSPLGTSFRIPSGAEPKYSEIGELLRWCFGAWVWSAMSWLPSPDSFASHTSRM